MTPRGTKRNTFPNGAVILALLLAPAFAKGQPRDAGEPYGPIAPVMPAQLEAVKRELEAEMAVAAQKHQEELAKVKRELAAEREANAFALRESARQLDEIRRTAQQALVVRAGRFGLTLSGFVHADAVAWRESSQDEVNPATGNPLNEARFLIRRARLRVEADYGIVGGALELDANTVSGATARVIGAEVTLRYPNKRTEGAPPYIALTLGIFKSTFGFEVMQESDKQRLFLERANVSRALFPGEYDLGVKLHGGWRFLRYAIAAMNGQPAGDKQFAARDPNQSKDFLGRVGVDTKVIGPFSLAGGFSALYGTGFSKGQPATKDTLVWRDINENNVVDAGEVQAVTGKVAVASKNFGRYAIGGDLQLRFELPKIGQLMLYAELAYGSNLDRGLLPSDPIASGRDLRQLGWYVGVTQELTKYAAIGLRYDQYNPDLDSDDLENGVKVPKDSTYSTIAVSAAARYPGRARLIAEYDHNTNALGRTMGGQPTTLADDAFILRGEVVF
jgi:hypothetical protein